MCLAGGFFCNFRGMFLVPRSASPSGPRPLPGRYPPGMLPAHVMISIAIVSFPLNAASIRGVNPSVSCKWHCGIRCLVLCSSPVGARRHALSSSLAHDSLPIAAHIPSSVRPRIDANLWFTSRSGPRLLNSRLNPDTLSPRRAVSPTPLLASNRMSMCSWRILRISSSFLSCAKYRSRHPRRGRDGARRCCSSSTRHALLVANASLQDLHTHDSLARYFGPSVSRSTTAKIRAMTSSGRDRRRVGSEASDSSQLSARSEPRGRFIRLRPGLW